MERYQTLVIPFMTPLNPKKKNNVLFLQRKKKTPTLLMYVNS